MSHSRNIYFDDVTFQILEDMVLYDSEGKKLSRSNKVKHLIHKNIGKARTVEAENFLKLKRYVQSAINQIGGLEYVIEDPKFVRRIEKALNILENIKMIDY